MANVQKLKIHMDRLVTTHRELDNKIVKLQNTQLFDDMELKAMKKRKLEMRQEIEDINTKIQEINEETVDTI